MELFDTIIIGSGPAGYTAAIYAARANLKVLVLKGNQPGGQLTTTTVIENWPGYADGIDGNELMVQMEKQGVRFGAKMEQVTVTAVDFSKVPFTVTCGDISYQGKTVIIATGARSRMTSAAGEAELVGKGVSTCATCDGFFYKKKDIIVIGGGDTAMEEANFLTKFANSVTIIHRRDSFRASKIMVDRTMANPKIKVIWDSAIEQFNGTDKLTSVTLKNFKTNETEDHPIDGVFLAIGHIPNTELFQGLVDLETNGYVKAHGATHTNIDGIFFAGDVEDQHYRQAVTAAGAGCKAAMDVEKYLASLS
ncbi:MAG: thioredoxin-disulfide reductase [Candidatus Kerfeldbacteria bacterium]|nr:thioredoxin-disulfide reductase [Candidatus Kerfeldbacteria bacterium]